MLVAVAVFTLIAGAGYTALDQGLDISARLEQERRFWRQLESAVGLLERDLARAVDIRPRTPAGHAPGFLGYFNGDQNSRHEVLRFSTRAPARERAAVASPFERVVWRIDEGQLRRAIWPRVDAPYGAHGDEHIILSDVERFRARYLAPGGRWLRRWEAGEDNNGDGLPVGLEISFRVAGYGEFTRIFHVGPAR